MLLVQRAMTINARMSLNRYNSMDQASTGSGLITRYIQLNSLELPQTEFPALETLNNRPNNLFRQPNAFFGREAELAELTGLLDEHPLVSIIAPGGYGKSRLAAHLCADLLPAFDNGVLHRTCVDP